MVIQFFLYINKSIALLKQLGPGIVVVLVLQVTLDEREKGDWAKR
jgi:hypothetical protein